MKANWFIIIPVIVAVLIFIAFFINRNKKDKNDFMRELIEDDEASIHKKHDTEDDLPE